MESIPETKKDTSNLLKPLKKWHSYHALINTKRTHSSYLKQKKSLIPGAGNGMFLYKPPKNINSSTVLTEYGGRLVTLRQIELESKMGITKDTYNIDLSVLFGKNEKNVFVNIEDPRLVEMGWVLDAYEWELYENGFEEAHLINRGGDEGLYKNNAVIGVPEIKRIFNKHGNLIHQLTGTDSERRINGDSLIVYKNGHAYIVSIPIIPGDKNINYLRDLIENPPVDGIEIYIPYGIDYGEIDGKEPLYMVTTDDPIDIEVSLNIFTVNAIKQAGMFVIDKGYSDVIDMTLMDALPSTADTVLDIDDLNYDLNMLLLKNIHSMHHPKMFTGIQSKIINVTKTVQNQENVDYMDWMRLFDISYMTTKNVIVHGMEPSLINNKPFYVMLYNEKPEEEGRKYIRNGLISILFKREIANNPTTNKKTYILHASIEKINQKDKYMKQEYYLELALYVIQFISRHIYLSMANKYYNKDPIDMFFISHIGHSKEDTQFNEINDEEYSYQLNKFFPCIIPNNSNGFVSITSSILKMGENNADEMICNLGGTGLMLTKYDLMSMYRLTDNKFLDNVTMRERRYNLDIINSKQTLTYMEKMYYSLLYQLESLYETGGIDVRHVRMETILEIISPIVMSIGNYDTLINAKEQTLYELLHWLYNQMGRKEEGGGEDLYNIYRPISKEGDVVRIIITNNTTNIKVLEIESKYNKFHIDFIMAVITHFILEKAWMYKLSVLVWGNTPYRMMAFIKRYYLDDILDTERDDLIDSITLISTYNEILKKENKPVRLKLYMGGVGVFAERDISNKEEVTKYVGEEMSRSYFNDVIIKRSPLARNYPSQTNLSILNGYGEKSRKRFEENKRHKNKEPFKYVGVFINESDTPNVRQDSGDEEVFVALRNIKKGEQILWDYGGFFESKEALVLRGDGDFDVFGVKEKGQEKVLISNTIRYFNIRDGIINSPPVYYILSRRLIKLIAYMNPLIISNEAFMKLEKKVLKSCYLNVIDMSRLMVVMPGDVKTYTTYRDTLYTIAEKDTTSSSSLFIFNSYLHAPYEGDIVEVNYTTTRILRKTIIKWVIDVLPKERKQNASILNNTRKILRKIITKPNEDDPLLMDTVYYQKKGIPNNIKDLVWYFRLKFFSVIKMSSSGEEYINHVIDFILTFSYIYLLLKVLPVMKLKNEWLLKIYNKTRLLFRYALVVFINNIKTVVFTNKDDILDYIKLSDYNLDVFERTDESRKKFTTMIYQTLYEYELDNSHQFTVGGKL